MTGPPLSLPKPIIIGAPAGPLFGWYQTASAVSAKPGEGIVLCNPLGYEAVCTHRAYRELATRLALAGYPSLRFDYHGTGDSSGTDHDPRRVDAMIQSIQAAMAALKSLSGADEISLFGVRMGASLAMSAAAEMGSVKNIVAWAPCIKGKTYLREMHAFSRMAETALGPAPKEGGRIAGDQEAGGYLMTKDTVAALSELNLLQLKTAPARNILILPGEEGGNDSALLTHLRESGSNVTQEDVAGYSDMMADPHLSIVPEQAFHMLIQWLSKRPDDGMKNTFPHRAISTSDSMRIQPQDENKWQVEEHPVYFGRAESLFGIVTETSQKERRSKAAVIFLNAGAVHRIGPNRLYTRLARQWAALGITCFRVDLSGIGDSRGEGPMDKRMYSDAAVKDVEEAMDFLRSRRSINQFVLVGLCSGAYVAFHAGLRAESVMAEILINPQTFYWQAGDSIELIDNNYREALYYRRALFRKGSWRKALIGGVNFWPIFKIIAARALNIAKEMSTAISELIPGRNESPNDLLRAFREMAKRKIHTLLVFSRDDGGLHYVETRLGRRARKVRGPNLRLEIIHDADHTLTPLWSQNYLCTLLTDYITRLLKPESSAPL